MAIYILKDFYSTFITAYNGKDTSTVRQMLMDEIAKAIMHDRAEVISLLKSINVSLPEKPNNSKIEAGIIANGSNPKLQTGLAYLIAKQNKLINEDGKASGSGDPVGNLTTGIADMFSNTKEGSVNRTAMEVSLLKLTKQSVRGKNSHWPLIIGGVILTGVIIWAIYNRKKEQPAEASSSLPSAEGAAAASGAPAAIPGMTS